MRGMNCERAAEFLPLYAAGDLAGESANEVASHLIACEGCRRLTEEFRESRALLVEAFETPEFGAEFYAGIRSSVLEKIARDREPSTPSFLAALFGRRLAYATTFAVALIALALAFQHFRAGQRETPRETAGGQRNVNAPRQEQRGGPEAPPQLNAKRDQPTPTSNDTAMAPHKESARRDAPARRRELTPRTVAPDDEDVASAQVAPSSVNVAHGASESAAAGGATPSATASGAPEVSRIEIQTADPSIRIIWLAPKESEAPGPNEPKNENGERK